MIFKKTNNVIILLLFFIVNDFYILKNSNFLKASTVSNDISKSTQLESNLNSNVYILGPGDRIQIKFVGVDELSGIFFIMRDGNIQLPLF